MSLWWNLPFAFLAVLALWCRIGAPERLVDRVTALLGYFGVDEESPRQTSADFFGIAGVSGLLFVAWGGELAALPDVLLLIDAVLSALGLGLVGAWLLSRLGGEGAAAIAQTERISREMTMMEVEELPQRTGGDPA